MEEQARHGEGEEQLDMVLDMKTFHGRAREEREACARREAEVQAGPRPGPTGFCAGSSGHRPGPTGFCARSAGPKPDVALVPSGRYAVGLEPPSGFNPVPSPVWTGPAGPRPGRPAV